MTLEHDRRDLCRVCKVGDARLEYLDARVVHAVLYLVAYAGRHNVARAAQAAVVGNAVAGGVHIGSHVIRINAHDVAQSAVALERKIFLVVVNIEDGLGGVYDAPCHGNTYLNGVAEAVVDLLAVVVERHYLEGYLLVRRLDLGALLCVCCNALYRRYVSALAELCFCRGVDRNAEGIYKVKSVAAQRADIFAEEREHERLLGAKHLEPDEGDESDAHPDAGYNKNDS